VRRSSPGESDHGVDARIGLRLQGVLDQRLPLVLRRRLRGEEAEVADRILRALSRFL
jgi:hypothetical protein